MLDISEKDIRFRRLNERKREAKNSDRVFYTSDDCQSRVKQTKVASKPESGPVSFWGRKKASFYSPKTAQNKFIFTIVNKDITNNNVKANINTVILTGRGITNINKSDVAGKINLNIPVKMSTGRAISTVKSEFRTSYALVRYIAARPFVKSVSNKIDTQSNESVFKVIMNRIKEFFYS